MGRGRVAFEYRALNEEGGVAGWRFKKYINHIFIDQLAGDKKKVCGGPKANLRQFAFALPMELYGFRQVLNAFST